MSSDFLDAHERHWEDAELLFANQRWANADHLYGLAAECGLKRLMKEFGMPFDVADDRPSRKKDQKHANIIWGRYDTYRSGHHAGTAYVLPVQNPFDNWSVNERYYPRNLFTKTRVERHRQGVEKVRKLITKARLDGLL